MTIKQSLETLGLPVAKSDYTGIEKTYITYFEYDENVEDSSDDEIATISHYIQVDLWTKTDYTNLKPQIKLAMKNAGFSFTNGQELFEEDTKTYHYATRYVAREDL